jgi:hypothetical protein
MKINELAAQCLIEASVMLTSPEDDSIESLQEAMSIILEAAINTDDDQIASDLTEKARELQEAIDDIPKEKPETDDDYDAGVNGSDDDNSKPSLEDTKDLLDNDKDAIEILTNNESNEIIDDSAFMRNSIWG